MIDRVSLGLRRSPSYCALCGRLCNRGAAETGALRMAPTDACVRVGPAELILSESSRREKGKTCGGRCLVQMNHIRANLPLSLLSAFVPRRPFSNVFVRIFQIFCWFKHYNEQMDTDLFRCDFGALSTWKPRTAPKYWISNI